MAGCIERKQNQQSQRQQSQIQTYFNPKGKVDTATPTTSKRGSAKISDYDSEAHNQQPSKKQALGGNGGSDTDELDRQIVEDHNQMEEVRQSRTLAIQLQVKMPDTSQRTSMLKRKGLNNMHCSQTNSKKYRVEEPQPTAIIVISGNDKERIAEKKREALENLKRSSQKRKATEDQMVIEREKKGRQRTGTLAPELKKQRMCEETNVLAQED